MGIFNNKKNYYNINYWNFPNKIITYLYENYEL